MATASAPSASTWSHITSFFSELAHDLGHAEAYLPFLDFITKAGAVIPVAAASPQLKAILTGAAVADELIRAHQVNNQAPAPDPSTSEGVSVPAAV